MLRFCTDLRQPFNTVASTFLNCKKMEAINIYPELQKWKINKQGLCAITIRLDYHRNRVGNEKLNQSIKINDWDPELKRVKKSHPQFELINLIIENKLSKHKNYFMRRQAFNLPVTKDLIKQYLNNGSLENFTEYGEWVIENKKLKDGKGYSTDTKRRYRDEISRLLQFKDLVYFKDITPKFLESYKLWMQNEYKKKDKTRLDQNSIWKAMGTLRMIYNEAVRNEAILPDDNPFKKFEVGSFKTKTEKIKYLESSDLTKIEEALTNKTASMQDMTVRIGWRFLAMCVSGLRISDAMGLDEAYFNDGGDLQFTPFKTRRHGNIAQVPIISDRQKQYLQKTMSLPLPLTDPKSFRTTFNIHLKVLAAVAGVEVQLTSHVGRHTMGSFLVDAGVEKKAAMAMLGVKRESVIETYMHLKESKLRKEAEKMKNIF